MKSPPNGKPQLRIGGLKIWIHGREFEDSQDYWDGNWLRATARCTNEGASLVQVEGSILHLRDIVELKRGCEAMNDTFVGSASLSPLEPNVRAELRIDIRGHIAVTVDIMHDQIVESHKFAFEIDQSYLPEIIASCRQILGAYPLRGAQSAV